MKQTWGCCNPWIHLNQVMAASTYHLAATSASFNHVSMNVLTLWECRWRGGSNLSPKSHLHTTTTTATHWARWPSKTIPSLAAMGTRARGPNIEVTHVHFGSLCTGGGPVFQPCSPWGTQGGGLDLEQGTLRVWTFLLPLHIGRAPLHICT